MCGILQGSKIGPYLYLIYVNDIFNLCTNSKCVLFADDTTVLTPGNNSDTLFSDSCSVFAAYSIWFADNILALNSKKPTLYYSHYLTIKSRILLSLIYMLLIMYHRLNI